jgi:DNA-binding NarL/FixJ family response regulator
MKTSVLTMAVQVLVVEDFAPFRRFVCSTLGTQEHLQVIAEVDNGLHAVNQAKDLQPDLIVLDIGLPGLNGIETARRILQFAPDVKIIFLTQEFSPEVVREALRVGANGYVMKTRAEDDLLHAIETVLQGKRFVSDGLEHS